MELRRDERFNRIHIEKQNPPTIRNPRMRKDGIIAQSRGVKKK